jgi:hypothetical protein
MLNAPGTNFLSSISIALLLGCCAGEPDDTREAGGKADDPAATTACLGELAALEQGAPRDVSFYDVEVNQFSGGAFSGNARTSESSGIDLPSPTAAAGRTLNIRYLGGLNQEADLAPVSVGLKINGVDEVHVMERDEEFAPRIFSKFRLDMPFDLESLEIWFQAEDPNTGELVFDSRDGANYVVHIMPAPEAEICFGQDFTLAMQGEILAGRSVQIAYDYNRILSQMQEELGFLNFWNITVGARFSDSAGTVISEAEQPITDGILFAGEDIFNINNLFVPIEIPGSATRMEIWFHGTSKDRDFFDSHHGANYVFDVDQP